MITDKRDNRKNWKENETDSGIHLVFWMVVIGIFLVGFFSGKIVTAIMNEEKIELQRIEAMQECKKAN